jgi:hypothetical protein
MDAYLNLTRLETNDENGRSVNGNIYTTDKVLAMNAVKGQVIRKQELNLG